MLVPFPLESICLLFHRFSSETEADAEEMEAEAKMHISRRRLKTCVYAFHRCLLLLGFHVDFFFFSLVPLFLAF